MSHTARLEQVVFRLRDRDRTLLSMCGGAIKKSDIFRAQMYAKEMVRVRCLIKTIRQCQLAVECIIIRLENFMELHGVIAELKPVSEMIQGIAGDVSKIMPNLASEMSQFNSLVSDTLLETSIDFSQPELDLSVDTSSSESEEIIKEVSSLLEQRLKDDLPEPPSIAIAVPATSLAPEMMMEAIPVNYESKNAVQKNSPDAIGVSQCARDLRILPENVANILDSLNARGKVRLEECVS